MPDLSRLESVAQTAVAQIMNEMTEKILQDTRKLWTGWKYKGRPPDGARNVSMNAWKANVETEQNTHTIWLRNDAIDWRAEYYSLKGNSALSAKYKDRPYVSIVSRRKGGSPEYLKVKEMITLAHIPELERKISESVVEAIKGIPRTTRTPRPSASSGMDIIV